MRLLTCTAIQLLALAGLTSANNIGVIDPDGKVHMDQAWDQNIKTPQYMTCTPKAGYKCGDKVLTTEQCLQSCKGMKGILPFVGNGAVINCDQWNGCDEKAMRANCGCQIGEWIAGKYPGKNPPTKDVKLVEDMPKD